ncbi:hypothetical protein HK096_007423 [Nowakowskiella sp. JEL0078]|nr:hypothetical protein HK096_007423 [Nowakowskiella sp. JEL0078]
MGNNASRNHDSDLDLYVIPGGDNIRKSGRQRNSQKSRDNLTVIHDVESGRKILRSESYEDSTNMPSSQIIPTSKIVGLTQHSKPSALSIYQDAESNPESIVICHEEIILDQRGKGQCLYSSSNIFKAVPFSS